MGKNQMFKHPIAEKMTFFTKIILLSSLFLSVNLDSVLSQTQPLPLVPIVSQRQFSSESEAYSLYMFNQNLGLERSTVDDLVNKYFQYIFDKQVPKQVELKKSTPIPQLVQYAVVDKKGEIGTCAGYVFATSQHVRGYYIFEYTPIKNKALIEQIKQMQLNQNYLSDVVLKAGDYEITFYESKHEGFVERYGVLTDKDGMYQNLILDAFYPEEMETVIQPTIRQAVISYLKSKSE